MPERLRARGPIDVATLFELAQTDARTGYYQRDPAAVFGATGDFVTAPEVSQVFGELVGLTLADAWQRAGAPAASLAELGPGRGTLMADLWRAVHRLPGVAAAWDVHLVERSASLQALQAERLAELRPSWHATTVTLPSDRPLLLVANEFLDALPVHQLVRAAEGWAERCVGWGEAGACWTTRPAPAALAAEAAHRFPAAGPGAIAELAPARQTLVRDLATRIAAAGGLALLVDYGGLATHPVDTLQAVKQHQSVAVLQYLGDADLSSAVDFGPLADAAKAAGAAVFGPLPQARVLRALGIELRALRLAERVRGPARQAVFSGVRRLLDATAMGEAFKVLAVTHPAWGVPAGFAAEDRW